MCPQTPRGTTRLVVSPVLAVVPLPLEQSDTLTCCIHLLQSFSSILVDDNHPKLFTHLFNVSWGSPFEWLS